MTSVWSRQEKRKREKDREKKRKNGGYEREVEIIEKERYQRGMHREETGQTKPEGKKAGSGYHIQERQQRFHSAQVKI